MAENEIPKAVQDALDDMAAKVKAAETKAAAAEKKAVAAEKEAAAAKAAQGKANEKAEDLSDELKRVKEGLTETLESAPEGEDEVRIYPKERISVPSTTNSNGNVVLEPGTREGYLVPRSAAKRLVGLRVAESDEDFTD